MPVTVVVELAIKVPEPVPQADPAVPLVVQSVKISSVRSNGVIAASVKTSTTISQTGSVWSMVTTLSPMQVAAPFAAAVISAPCNDACVVS